MLSYQGQPVIRVPIFEDTRVSAVAAGGRLMALFTCISERCWRRRDGGVPSYGGRAWCDSLEQQVITDIQTFRRPGGSQN